MSQVWLITGSSRGLGRSIATAALEAGHKLIATARKPEQLGDFVDRFGDHVRPVALDVTDAAAASRVVDEAVSAFGRLDVVVNNAGYANVNSFEDLPADDFRAQVETNLFGVVNVTRAAVRVMREQRGGHIIQISSIGGRHATPGLAAYQAAKWAVGGFSEVVARETASLGIRVTVVEPGGMRTEWAGSSMRIDEIASDYHATVGAMAAHFQNGNDIMRGDPDKIAQVILRIAAEPNPPVRLLLGSDAVAVAAAANTERQRVDEQWRTVSLSTDFDGLAPFHETSVAQIVTTA
jgi:NAD(P)-dependent dehydrogenase (short-subunit alcohol dehydrogenase family)